MKLPKARKLPSGSWFIQLRLGGESIPVTARTEKECIRQAQYVKAEYIAGRREKRFEEPKAVSPTLGEAIDAYIAKRDAVLSPSTIAGYKVIRRNRFQTLMDRRFEDISEKEWVFTFNAEVKRLSAKTVKNTWGFLQTVIREELQKDPPKVKMPQVPPNEKLFLDPEQIRIFVSAVHGSEIEIPALLALSSLRRSEIMALRWENVDFKKRQIAVKGAAVFDSESHLVYRKENKNRSSNRIVPILMDELYSALRAKQQPEGLVVTLHPNTVWRKINQCCQSAGLPPVGIHGLRHSFASLAYHLDVPEKIVMEIGGWADYQTMRTIYTHIARADISKSAGKLQAFFSAKDANDNANKI